MCCGSARVVWHRTLRGRERGVHQCSAAQPNAFPTPRPPRLALPRPTLLLPAHRQLPAPCVLPPSPQKHGLKSASKRDKARAAAEEEADELLALKERLGVMHEEVRLNCW